MGAAYQREQSPAAKDAMAQILTNSRMCAQGHRPLCQDTGIVVAFVRVGMDVRWNATMDVVAMVNAGVRKAYLDPDNKLRASILSDPAGTRKNTGRQYAAVVHVELVPGDKVDVRIAAKGGGSENKSTFKMLNPGDDIVEWVLQRIPEMGAGWCPPGVLGIGIGGTAEKAMLLAKESLMESIDIHELKLRGAKTGLEQLRLEIYDKINALGIGAQGLGGLTTVLDVKILDYPTHAASKPIAMIPNCAAMRHILLSSMGTAWPNSPRPNLKIIRMFTGSHRRKQGELTSTASLAPISRHGSRARPYCCLENCSLAAMRRINVSVRYLRAAINCPRAWILPADSSIMSGRLIRFAMKSSARQDPQPQRAWTSSLI